MNYLVTYRSTNGATIKRKTYTFIEADVIARKAVSKLYKDVTVSPLNKFASDTLNSIVSINNERHTKEFCFNIILK